MVSLSRFSTSVLLGLGVATAGCSGESSNVDHAGGGNAGNAGQGGNTPGATGGVGNANGGSAALGGGGGTSSTGASHAGQFILYSIARDPSTNWAVAGASFYTGAPPTCSSQVLGDCVFKTGCTGPATPVSAGTLTITSPASATVPANDLRMVPNADNTYSSVPLAGRFAGGEVVHVSAMGATVPAFSADLTVPVAILINSPTPDSYGTIHASASDDLVIQFSRATSDVRLSVQTIPDGEVELECNSALGASTFTIPKEALAVAGRQIYLFTRASKGIVAGDFVVDTDIIMNAYTTDKAHPVTIALD